MHNHFGHLLVMSHPYYFFIILHVNNQNSQRLGFQIYIYIYILLRFFSSSKFSFLNVIFKFPSLNNNFF